MDLGINDANVEELGKTTMDAIQEVGSFYNEDENQEEIPDFPKKKLKELFSY